MLDKLIALAIQEAPDLIARLRAAYVAAHPGDHPPTDADIIEAYQGAFVSSLAKDDRWLAAHPETPTNDPAAG